MSEFDGAAFVRFIGLFADRLHERRDELTELDSAIGDADHGINMDRGFTAVRAKLAELDGSDLGATAKAVGMTLISTVGGASGPLYGTFFLRLATAIGDRTALDPAELGAALRAGLEGVIHRGKADDRRQDHGGRHGPGGRRLRGGCRRGNLGRPRSGSRGSGRGTRPHHAAGGPQGAGELPRGAVGEPPGPGRDLDHDPVRIPPRRRRGELIRRTDHERKAAIDMAKYVLALDQGTTSSRAILFNADGTIHTTANQEFPQIFPSPGHVEHDPEAIWDSQLAVAKKVIADAGASPDDIAAIGITNQRETTVVWDKNTGKPVQNAIVWQSRITAGYCDELKAAGHEAKFREKTGLPVDAYFSGTKIRHILKNNPGRAGEGGGRRAALRHRRQLPHLAPDRGQGARRRLLEREPHAPVQHPHARLG